MSTPLPPLRIAIIAGEESGDLLGADLVAALAKQTGRDIAPVGVGGAHLQALGLHTYFDPHDLALMGVTAILGKLPRLLNHIRRTARQIIESKPDCLIIIDAPEFTQRVAARVKAALPDLPVVNYVCPSVWAWRSGRAKAMAKHVDHVLCLLPFEPEALSRLGGPPGTYVGHRLRKSPEIEAVRDSRAKRDRFDQPTILVLPGSRRGEVKRLAGTMAEAIRQLRAGGTAAHVVIPTLPHLKSAVEAHFAGLDDVEISDQPADKWRFFSDADAAIAASGTVTLELALCGIPHCSVYRFDWLMAPFLPRILTTWSGCLPNLIADRLVIPEHYGSYFRPDISARILAGLADAGSPQRWAQIDAFETIRQRLETPKPSGLLAAEIVTNLLNEKGRL